MKKKIDYAMKCQFCNSSIYFMKNGSAKYCSIACKKGAEYTRNKEKKNEDPS